MSISDYSYLANFGFRRSGNSVYMPKCKSCNDCIPVRIPIRTFISNRSQRRTWNRNKDITVTSCKIAFHEEHFRLYRQYMKARHQSSSMDNADPDQYLSFISSSWCNTKLLEFRLNSKLICVAVVDQLHDALSAVYTFFSPEHNSRSLGVYALLWQIELARKHNFSWLYLGYWIEDSKKMNYKSNYQPLELYKNGTWTIMTNKT